MDLVTEQRLERRSMILAAVRQMIVDRGYAAVTVRELAVVCRVSVPTLYNQFGGKDQLLAAAIEDHFRIAHDSLDFRTAESGLDRLLAIIDHSARQLLDLSTYHQRLIAAFSSLGTTTQVQMRVATVFAEVLVAELLVMQGKRQLVGWIDPAQLAGQMVAASIGTAVQWSAGFISSTALESSMRYAMGLVLLGALRGQGRERLALMVREAQAALPVVSLPSEDPNQQNSRATADSRQQNNRQQGAQ